MNSVTSNGVYNALATYRSASYYNAGYYSDKYILIGKIITMDNTGNKDSSFVVRLFKYDLNGFPFTAIFAGSIRANGNVATSVNAKCHNIFGQFNSKIVCTWESIGTNQFELKLYFHFTIMWERVCIEVLNSAIGDIGDSFNRVAVELPMEIVETIQGTTINIEFN